MGTNIKVNKKIVFYDGFCLVCSRFINLLIKADKKKENRFTTISSQFSKKILKEKLDSKDIGKFIVYLSNDKVYLKSDAVLQIFIEIGGIYKLFTLLKIFPSGLEIYFMIFLLAIATNGLVNSMSVICLLKK